MVLIVGALGVVGRAALRHMSELSDWEVTGLSRRAPDFETSARFISVDLMEKNACREALGGSAFSHIVYAALHEQPSIVSGWLEDDHVRTNLAMMDNLLDAVDHKHSQLQHITVMQGGKAYGVHLGPRRRIPSKESDPRTMPPNFYYDQEDLLRERQKGKAWSWTALRPPSVCGFAVGSPMNTILAVGVYAAICRELGIPLSYPGAEGHLIETCDARLLAKSIAWAGTTPACANQAFNIANGDCFMWEHMWPVFARAFDMEHAPPHNLSLARVMPDKSAVWDRIVKKHDLQPFSLSQLVPSWEFTDFLFRYGRPPYPSLMSTVKARQAGFHDCVDSEDMFASLLRELQAERILPR